MDNSSKFFANKACQYFPCHEGLAEDEFSCMFCYCPLNAVEHCPGNPSFFKRKDGSIIKDCTGCNFPHRAENYETVLNFVKKNLPTFGERVLEEK